MNKNKEQLTIPCTCGIFKYCIQSSSIQDNYAGISDVRCTHYSSNHKKKEKTQSILNKIVEEHQKGQRKFILTTSDDMEHYIHVNSLLDLAHEIHFCFYGQLLYEHEDFVSLEEENISQNTESVF